MTRILAVADEVDDALASGGLPDIQADLVIGCGDLRFDYLEYLAGALNAPLAFVPGNHDADLGRPVPWVPPLVAEDFARGRGPRGSTNIDGRIDDFGGLRVAGLGGSMRYKPGPNQYTEAQMRRRAWLLRFRAWTCKVRDGRGVDVLVTHAPPRDCGDDDDPAHRGFRAFHEVVAALEPSVMIHGHVHPYGLEQPDRTLNNTSIVNAVGHRIVEVDT